MFLERGWSRRALALVVWLMLALLPPTASASSQTDEKFTVLSFHEIADPGEALIPEYAVTPTMFVRQIDWLKNNGYNFVSVDDILADREGHRDLPPKAVLITFDDGYRSMYEHAWPLLKMLWQMRSRLHFRPGRVARSPTIPKLGSSRRQSAN